MTAQTTLYLIAPGDLPTNVPTTGLTGVLYGLAAIIAAVAASYGAVIVARRKAVEDQIPVLRSQIRRLVRRDLVRQRNEEIQQHNMLLLLNHVYDLETRLAGKQQPIPRRPKLQMLVTQVIDADDEGDDEEIAQ